MNLPAMTELQYRNTVIISLALLGIALYIHTLDYPINFDTIFYLAENPLIKGFSYYDDLLNYNKFARLDEQLRLHQDLVTNFMLRPFANLTFSLNYALDGLDPDGYRGLNIAIHILNAILIFLLVSRLLAICSSKTRLDAISQRFIATTTALLFLAHPLQTESFIYIIQRYTSLAATFYYLTILLYLCASTSSSLRRRNIFRFLSLLAMLLGMLVKENVFTAPLALILLELVILQSPIKTALQRASLHLIFLPFVPLMVMLTSAAQNSAPLSLTSALNIVNYDGYRPVEYAITQLCVITTYLRLFILPYGQNIDPDYPLYTSLLQGRVILSLAVICTILISAFILYRRRSNDSRYRLIFFGTLWFFLAISVSSSIIPLPDLMAEHRSYLASLGFFLVCATILDLFRSSRKSASASSCVMIVLAVFMLLLCSLTYARTEVWHSGITLWQDAASKSPLKARPWFNLGMTYFGLNDFRQAEGPLKRAIEVNSDYLPAYLSLSAVYIFQERFAEAIAICDRGLKQNPGNAGLLQNMGEALLSLGYLSEAELVFIDAIECKAANSLQCHLSLASAYMLMSRFEAALTHYRAAAKLSIPNTQLLQSIHNCENLVRNKKSLPSRKIE